MVDMMFIPQHASLLKALYGKLNANHLATLSLESLNPIDPKPGDLTLEALKPGSLKYQAANQRNSKP